MPLTRSAASGNQKSNETDKASSIVTKKTKGKSAKREAEKDVDEAPPQKLSKKITNEENGIKKTPTQSKKSQKKSKNEQEEHVETDKSDDVAWENAETIYEFIANDIKGNQVSLDKYKGYVCIIVNVASRCGHTKSNYEQFVEIFDKYSEAKGLKILAFPCNQFGKQEPGDSVKICEFANKYNVKFDMFEKVEVNGKNAHPLWKFLSNKISGPKGKAIAWNFTKFIIDKEGKVVERHPSAAKPLKLIENLEKYW